ncbi:methylamine utilization protein [Chitinimonas sp. BJYL2]|uniref:methylamine utilization protein n=1 Tax=Chitinimonas sp. BJYL2 TaxID=2976696 RepID=UPI0022B56438|nr:methylamine utilization protein [Chitinimonas sp. BJYL2]
MSRLFALLASLCVCAAHAERIEVQVTNTQGQAVSEAAVYLEPVSGKAPKGKLSGVIDQIDKEFVPLVSVVQTGTAILFPNKDNVRHSIYSFSPAKTFELKLYSGTPAAPVVFDKPGQVVLGCNIHDWMTAYLLVVESPWFGKTGKDGKVVLSELPAGDFVLKVWHPYQVAAAADQRVKVGAGANQRFAFRLKVEPPASNRNASY